MFETVVIGIDGRQGGRDAIALAKQMAPAASFTLAHVTGGATAWWGRAVSEEIPFLRQTAMLAAERRAAGIDARIICVTESSAARGLHDLAQRLSADLIVVGSCRHGPLGRVLIGDDARASVAGARCPVAVAPHGYADQRHASGLDERRAAGLDETRASGLDQPVIQGVAHQL